MLGRVCCGWPPWQRALCGQRGALLTQPVQSRWGSWRAAVSQRQQQVETGARALKNSWLSIFIGASAHFQCPLQRHVLTFYSVDLRSLMHIVLYHIHTIYFVLSLSLQILISKRVKNNGIRVQECTVFIVIFFFFLPAETFLSHLSYSSDILAFCLSRLHTSSVCRFK